MATLNNFADVQNLLNTFISANSLTPGLAPHGVFWETTYDNFVNGLVPNIGVPILVKGDPDNSYIIQVLKGPYNGFNQMPRPSPEYNAKTPEQTEVISELSDWIKNGCPNNDKLTQIEGIGPKIHATLKNNGIHSFEELAGTKVAQLRKILHDAGLPQHDPGTWPAQANLAHNGEMESLQAFQDHFIGGKPPQSK